MPIVRIKFKQSGFQWRSRSAEYRRAHAGQRARGARAQRLRSKIGDLLHCFLRSCCASSLADRVLWLMFPILYLLLSNTRFSSQHRSLRLSPSPRPSPPSRSGCPHQIPPTPPTIITKNTFTAASIPVTPVDHHHPPLPRFRLPVPAAPPRPFMLPVTSFGEVCPNR